MSSPCQSHRVETETDDWENNIFMNKKNWIVRKTLFCRVRKMFFDRSSWQENCFDIFYQPRIFFLEMNETTKRRNGETRRQKKKRNKRDSWFGARSVEAIPPSFEITLNLIFDCYSPRWTCFSERGKTLKGRGERFERTEREREREGERERERERGSRVCAWGVRERGEREIECEWMCIRPF